MFSDIVLPKNNEAEFIQTASKLNIKKLNLLYDFDYYDEDKIKKKLDSIENKKINIEIGLIVNQKNMNRAAKISRFLVAKSSEKDRIFIESNKIKIIYGFEESGRKDYIHQRASGLNHILCELARENNVSAGFSYCLITSNKNPALVIGRIIQNIELCKKYKVNTVIASFSSNPFELRSHYDISSMFRLFGSS